MFFLFVPNWLDVYIRRLDKSGNDLNDLFLKANLELKKAADWFSTNKLTLNVKKQQISSANPSDMNGQNKAEESMEFFHLLTPAQLEFIPYLDLSSKLCCSINGGVTD